MPELQDSISLGDITYHVEQLAQLVRVFRHTLIILVTASQVLTQLQTVVHWEAIVEQFVVEPGECPISFIISDLLSIEVIGLIGKVVRK